MPCDSLIKGKKKVALNPWEEIMDENHTFNVQVVREVCTLVFLWILNIINSKIFPQRYNQTEKTKRETWKQ